MFRKKVAKVTLVLVCLVTLIMPHISVVLAAALTKNDTTAELLISPAHEGGEESSGTVQETENYEYDTNSYIYTVGGVKVYKITTEDFYDDANHYYENEFYCLDATKSFPGITAQGINKITFNKTADLKNADDLKVKALHMGANSNWQNNYKAVIWLMDNMFLRKRAPEQKDAFLAKAFDSNTYDLDAVKLVLTDSDIEVVQQRAIWYFTNGDETGYNATTLPAVEIQPIAGETNNLTGIRKDYADHLYEYLINTAQNEQEQLNKKFPEFDTDATKFTSSEYSNENNTYYKLGPIKIKSAENVAPEEYTIKLYDQNNNEIDRQDYEIYLENGNQFTDLNLNQIFNQNYYICISTNNTSITSGRIEISYNDYETDVSLWENNTVDDNNEKIYQPVALVLRESTPHSPNIPFEIVRPNVYDLALRKYIVSVSGTNVNRAPSINLSKLKSNPPTATTAEYKHSKKAVTVSHEDTIVYEIRVYNEGNVAATGIKVVDALPQGLELVEGSTINNTYGWELAREGNNLKVYRSSYLENQTIPAFNKDTDTELPSKYVQIECKITTNLTATTTLRNIAEIETSSITDRDSSNNEVNNSYIVNDLDTSTYSGDSSNPSNLSTENYYYKGQEDDDDFENVVVNGKKYDLSLQKFATKINQTTVRREPSVNVDNLVNGGHDATYSRTKTPLEVKQGDIVVYALKVYNEGQIDGYAEEIADYLPEGLGYLPQYTLNIDNYWAIPDGSVEKSINDEYFKDIKDVLKSNLSKDDFTGVEDLDNVSIVLGKVKLTSTRLKSSSIDATKNLIKAFDPNTRTISSSDTVYIACIVLADTIDGNNLKNIAEIVRHTDNNRNEIEDIDSHPDRVNPDTYPEDRKEEDDDDYEKLTTKKDEKFDLCLQKFITKVNSTTITGRVVENYSPSTTLPNNPSPVKVEIGDLVTYTIRVYNQGNVAGYASEIADSIPEGLIFVTDNSTNKKYGWKMYDKSGNITTKVDQAVTVKTDYLSKEKSSSNLLAAFRGDETTNYSYKDVEVVFKISDSAIKKTLKNIAEITGTTDENGRENNDADIDSTPNNRDKKHEDDDDYEEVYVKYFDLELQKALTKIIVTENGTTREIAVSSTDGLRKVEIHRKRVNTTEVKFVYAITVRNTGEIDGYATEVKDYIPNGLKFVESDEYNSKWNKTTSGSVITTNALANIKLKPGETATVNVTLRWDNGENNLGEKVNAAEISKDKNDSNTPDIDSTPDNYASKKNEDDDDTASVFLAISTGTGPTYFALAFTILTIMTTGIALIKKFVL